jgi:hypothetical protein
VFDETFFQTSLSEHIKTKGTENADQPSVHVTLRNGQKYKIGRILNVRPQAFPSPPWICSRAQHRSAPCTCAESSVSSRTCTPSAPGRCAHGKERQSRSVERATGPTPPSSTAPPWLTPSRHRLRGVQATQSSRTNGRIGMPVCAAVGGPASAAAETASPLG